MKYLICFFLILFVGCVSQENHDAIPLISHSKKSGTTTITYVSSDQLTKRISPFISDVSFHVTDVLEEKSSFFSSDHFKGSENDWELSRVTVGLKLESEFKVLNEVLEIENEAEIELRFQKI